MGVVIEGILFSLRCSFCQVLTIGNFLLGMRRKIAMREQAQNQPSTPAAKWSERLKALGKVPHVFRIVWTCAPPRVVVFSVIGRLGISVIPVGLLWVTRIIIDSRSPVLQLRKRPIGRQTDLVCHLPCAHCER